MIFVDNDAEQEIIKIPIQEAICFLGAQKFTQYPRYLPGIVDEIRNIFMNKCNLCESTNHWWVSNSSLATVLTDVEIQTAKVVTGLLVRGLRGHGDVINQLIADDSRQRKRE